MNTGKRFMEDQVNNVDFVKVRMLIVGQWNKWELQINQWQDLWNAKNATDHGKIEYITFNLFMIIFIHFLNL